MVAWHRYEGRIRGRENAIQSAIISHPRNGRALIRRVGSSHAADSHRLADAKQTSLAVFEPRAPLTDAPAWIMSPALASHSGVDLDTRLANSHPFYVKRDHTLSTGRSNHDEGSSMKQAPVICLI